MIPGDLPCQEWVELVTDYLEGALSGAQQTRFEAHLAGCAGCATYLAQMRQTMRLTGTLAADELASPPGDELRRWFRGWQREPPE